MNQELIDKLIHKAGARFGAEGIDYSDFTSSKFADLIVRECSNFLKDTLDEHFAAEQLEEHFGVEE
jgi:uncharacterized tellurite resistance protein B-like protein